MKPIVVRGGGDLATGTIHRLCSSGYPVIILECERPSAIRRKVAFSQAVYEGTMEVEGITCVREQKIEDALESVRWDSPRLLTDPVGKCLDRFRPDILIDGILAKRNLGTNRSMAELTIALGPGFTAGEDVDYVIETKRGHYLGRIISDGQAIADTGIPGLIGGYGKERVLHSPCAGEFYAVKEIGDWVGQGETVGYVACHGTKVPVKTQIGGVLRGILPQGFPVPTGFKLADVDPRKESQAHCALISDKARCIAGSVLELVSGYEKGILKKR